MAGPQVLFSESYTPMVVFAALHETPKTWLPWPLTIYIQLKLAPVMMPGGPNPA